MHLTMGIEAKYQSFIQQIFRKALLCYSKELET